MRFLLFFGTLLFCFSTKASVDTVAIYSTSMKKNIKTVVILPASYSADKHYPTVYLLHGYSDTYNGWIRKVPQIEKMSEAYQVIIVCPDGGFSSWYFDSPIDSTYRYETFVSTEVPLFIDAHYNTIPDRKARAITGLSMGGHGGMFLGFRHADAFGACGSMSGGVDLNYSRNKFDVVKRIGDTINHAENWINYSVIHAVESYPKEGLAIIFDCGVDDFFYKDNVALHNKMLTLKIKHDYTERPGKHEWSYWANSVQYQLLFFRNFFDRK
jgi:S-formylglutathione hydrolase FrmB